jgi:hypothetical protein
VIRERGWSPRRFSGWLELIASLDTSRPDAAGKDRGKIKRRKEKTQVNTQASRSLHARVQSSARLGGQKIGLWGVVVAVGIVGAVTGCGSQAGLRVTVPVRLKYPSVTPLPAGTRNIAIPAFAAFAGNNDQAWWVTSGHGALWLSGSDPVVRIDPGSGRPSAKLGLASQLAVTPDTVIGADYGESSITVLDPVSGATRGHVTLSGEPNPSGIAFDGRSAWVTLHHSDRLLQVDPATGRTLASVKVPTQPDNGPQDPGVGFGSVWFESADKVVRVNVNSHAVTTLSCGAKIACVSDWVLGRRLAWVNGGQDGPGDITAIDPKTDRVVASFDTGFGALGQMVLDGESLWFVGGWTSNGGAGRPAYLVHIRTDGTVLARYRLTTGLDPGGLALADGSAWVGGGSAVVTRIPLSR